MLQNALNDSPNIFLLGEPNLRHDTEPGFAARYNGRHRAWGNQETKSSFCPAVLDEDGTWRDYLEALGRHYRWVGAKLVVNPIRSEKEMDELFAFHCRHFYVVALYVRMLRNLPHVRAVFHESLDTDAFAALQAWLEFPLTGADTYYDQRRVRSYDDSTLSAEDREVMNHIRKLYDDLSGGVSAVFVTPQLEQNDGHLSPDHYTLLGSIDRRARTLSEHLS